MNTTLPILLLIFGGLSFWILVESKLKWYLKVFCISLFCLFTVVFWNATDSFLGWPANKYDMPEKTLLHWVVIKEPNKLTGDKGGIYVLGESVYKEDRGVVNMFNYKIKGIKPRLFEFPYSRKLHEQLEKGVMAKLKKGQPVQGKFKENSKSSGRKGDKGKNGEDGDGSESQEQDWEFHELSPSEIHRKPREDIELPWERNNEPIDPRDAT